MADPQREMASKKQVEWAEGSVVEDQNLDGVTLQAGQTLLTCRFIRCSFRSARLVEIVTEHCEFQECDFTGARLGSSKHLASFLNCNFTDADLYGANLGGCRMVGSTFAGAYLSSCKADRGDWSYVQMRMQELDGVDFLDSKLVGADFYGASLKKANFVGCDLTDANFGNANLEEADFRSAKLSGAQLAGAKLKGARMNLEQALYFAATHGIVIE